MRIPIYSLHDIYIFHYKHGQCFDGGIRRQFLLSLQMAIS